MKRVVVADSLSQHRSEIYEAFEYCKPKISKAAENLNAKLSMLRSEYEADKQAAYDNYIDNCHTIADNAVIKLKMQNINIDESEIEYLFNLLVDYADIK